MNVPLTPHPIPFPPRVEATIFYYLSLKLSNIGAINDLVALKNNGTMVEESRLSSQMDHLQKVLNNRDSPWSKQAVRKELERYVTRDILNYIADIDEDCVAMLRKASQSVWVVASVSTRIADADFRRDSIQAFTWTNWSRRATNSKPLVR